MFKINANPTFNRTVTIPVPVDGGHENQTIAVTYRALSDDELEMFDMFTLGGQKQFLSAAIEKLDDLIDEDKQPVPFSELVLERVIGLSYARNPLMKGYSDAMVPALAGN